MVGIPLALYLRSDPGERFVLFFIPIIELLNTAIKKLADRVISDTDPLIKRAKDMGSAAIFLSLISAGAVWLWILAERFWR